MLMILSFLVMILSHIALSKIILVIVLRWRIYVIWKYFLVLKWLVVLQACSYVEESILLMLFESGLLGAKSSGFPMEQNNKHGLAMREFLADL